MWARSLSWFIKREKHSEMAQIEILSKELRNNIQQLLGGQKITTGFITLFALNFQSKTRFENERHRPSLAGAAAATFGTAAVVLSANCRMCTLGPST